VRAALCAIVLIACGDDSSGPKIGAPCDIRGTASDQCPGGQNARCFSPGLTCGPGFCSQSCDTVGCPDGTACVPLTILSLQTGQPQTIHRCFQPCDHDVDCGTPDGRLYCDQTYKVCSGGAFLGNLGSTGAHKPDGTACMAPPAANTPLLGANHQASAASEHGANEPALATDGAGHVFVAFNGGDFAVSRSTDDGVTWQPVATPEAAYGGDPGLALDAMGRLYFSYLAFPQQLVCDSGADYPGGDELHVVFSDDMGASWSPPMNVAPGMFVSSHYFVDKPWLTTGTNGDVFVSFTPFPSVSATAPDDLWVAYSHDRGLTWSASQLSDAGRTHGRSLAMLSTDAAGKVYGTWWEDAGDPLAPGGLIWMAVSNDRGVTWQPNVQVTPEADAYFDDPEIVAAPDGSVVYVTYQRIPPLGSIDEYDVMASVSIGGAPFAAPVKVNDDPSCATHFHASAAVDPASGDLHVIWYDNRYGDGRVMWSRARKPTGALTFAPNQPLTDTSFPFSTTRLQFFLGDYTSLAIANGKMYAAWTDLRADVPMPPNGAAQSAIFVAAGALPP
jgi:BNR repeat protein